MEKPGTAFNKLPIHGVFHTTSAVITTIDLILQLYCIFLIVRVSASNMRQYRRFLLFSTICDVCYAAITGIGQPRHFEPEFPYPCTALTGPIALAGRLCRSSLAALITSQYYALVYRVVIVSDFRRLKAHIARPPLFALGTTICLAIAVGLGYIQFNALWPDRQTLTVANGTDVGYITAEDTAVFCVRLDSYMAKATAGTLLLFTASELFFLSCAGWIIWKVKKQSALSQRTKSMHLQLTRLLIAQMLSPVVCMLVPIAVILVNGILWLDFDVFLIYLAIGRERSLDLLFVVESPHPRL